MTPGAAAEAPQVAIEHGVEVGAAGGRPLLADVYRPPEPLATRPAALLIHGGAWRMGDRAQLAWYGIMLGRRGYLCVACEYRLAQEAAWPAQIHDVKTALRWMRAQAGALGIDAARIAAWGHSAGGHLALFAAGTQNEAAYEGGGGSAGAGTDVAAAVAYYAPAALERSADGGWDSAEALLGGNATDEAMRAASPIGRAGAAFPPTLLIHGADDETVPAEQSVRMHEALARAGATSELHVRAGLPHSFDLDREFGRESLALGAAFLDRYLAGTAPAGAPEARRRMAEIREAEARKGRNA